MNDLTSPAITTVTASPRTGLEAATEAAFRRALCYDGKCSNELLAVSGMSGKKYRYFINNLIESLPDPHYLEIGVWAGSTLCSAIYGNKVSALAIDNWSQFQGPYDIFLTNLAKFKNPDAKVSFLEQDFRSVDYRSIGKFDVYLFDGPHNEADQYDGVAIAQPALKNEFVLIVDDWNWRQVRKGTHRAIIELELTVSWCAEVRSTQDDTTASGGDWHNGYFIGVMKKS